MQEENFNTNHPDDPKVEISMIETRFVGQDNHITQAVQENEANILVHTVNVALTATNQRLKQMLIS